MFPGSPGYWAIAGVANQAQPAWAWRRGLDFLHQGFHCEAFGSVEFCQSVCYAVSLPLSSVLAYLPLAFKPLDGQFQTDNPFQLRLNEVFRRIADFPWNRRCRFMDVGQFLHIRQKPLVVLD